MRLAHFLWVGRNIIDDLSQGEIPTENRSYPIANFIMFDNGTVNKILKHTNVSSFEWEQMKELIYDFSPILAKDLYSVEMNVTSDYYEASGDYFLQPNFSNYYNDSSKIHCLSKNYSKDSFANIRLPNSSSVIHKTDSYINHTSGHLITVSSNSSTMLLQEQAPQLEPEDEDDYFLTRDEMTPKYQKNFGKSNWYLNNSLGTIGGNSSSHMTLKHF